MELLDGAWTKMLLSGPGSAKSQLVSCFGGIPLPPRTPQWGLRTPGMNQKPCRPAYLRGWARRPGMKEESTSLKHTHFVCFKGPTIKLGAWFQIAKLHKRWRVRHPLPILAWPWDKLRHHEPAVYIFLDQVVMYDLHLICCKPAVAKYQLLAWTANGRVI